ncbi:hypothetical protein [Nevskia sp.]|uniref:hypothetical protein n=1 Tax=Nevskia sp. TaxID=1929292 RepID=UPI0025DA2677|nr:hypothetical protein [Nevskia sp.]
MIARPILFSGPMMRALLEGRKTQTRRVVKFPAKPPLISTIDSWMVNGVRVGRCPYGQPGDLLWVREAHAMDDDGHRGWPLFRADGASLPILPPSRKPARWKPGIHMPRWASRLTLRITDVRVQRLHDCSRGDAMAEGCPFANMQHGPDPRRWYADSWESINGLGSWDANPWVWALTFGVIKASISEVSP